MNLVNWLFIFIVSLLGIGALGHLARLFSQRHHGLWSILSLAFASVVSASIFATLFVHSPVVTSAMQTAVDQAFTCVGVPAFARAGDAITITGQGEAGSTVTVQQGAATLATVTIDSAGAYATAITLNTPGVQSVSCQAVAATGQAQTITLSFLIIGQAAVPTTAPTIAPTAAPTATNRPAPTATNTAEPTATSGPAVAAPVIDETSIPEEILPGETFRLLGTAAGNSKVRVAINDRIVAGAVTGPSGNWRTTIGFAAAGTYTLTAQLIDNDIIVAESEAVMVTVLAPTPTATPVPTATNTPEPTATNTPEPTATNTPEPTATNTPQPTATNTPEPTFTNTPEPTATNTPQPTATNTPEPTATNTPEPTATNTPEPTATNTPEPTATNTPEPTATNTPQPTATNTPEPTATNTPTAAPPVVDLASIPEQLLPGETFRLRGTAAGGAKVNVTVNDRIVGGAVAGPNGNWRTTVGFAAAGTYTLTAQLIENDAVTLTSEPIIVTVIAPTPTVEPTVEPTTEPTTVAAVAAPIDTAQTVTDTVAAPAELPGTGGDGRQGLPWVVMLLLLGALLVLGVGRLKAKPIA